MYPEASVAALELQRRLTAGALVKSRRAWSRVDTRFIRSSWAEQLQLVLPTLLLLQEQVAASADYAIAPALAATKYVMPDAFVDPKAFAGRGYMGIQLAQLLESPTITALQAIKQGSSPRQALARGRHTLDLVVQSTMADTARSASQVNIMTRRGVGYTRMLNVPSCRRCIVLAGRWYAWNQGFQRHPRCDCRHVPCAENASQDLTTDPYEYFHSLSSAEQDATWGKADAEALREGADLYRVENARRVRAGTSARSRDGLTTTEGTTKRGIGVGPGRLTPDGIFKQANGNRARARELLEQQGYILPGGQVPGGSIVGTGPQAAGFGQLGGGGARRGAREAVLEARRTGVRDPNSRYTMTAAERRVHDAKTRWEALQAGRNPFSSSGKPLTDQQKANIESAYKRWVIGQ